MCMNNGKWAQCGFTLIEIMIVVAIIALLTAIAVPAFMEYRRDTYLALCLANLRLIQSALGVYQIKEGTYPASANDIVGYLGTIPACPISATYDWDLQPAEYHIRCSAQHTPTISHVCIHEDQKPTAK